MARLLRTRQLQIHLWLYVTPDSMGTSVTAGNLEQSMEAFLSRFEAGFCLIKNNKHSNHWTRKYTKYHSVLTKLRLGCLSCAVVGEQRCWREVSRPQLQSNCNGHLSITFTYSWQKFSTLKQARRWTIHNVLIKIWITFFHLLLSANILKQKKQLSKHTELYFLQSRLMKIYQTVLSAHVTAAVSSANFRDST